MREKIMAELKEKLRYAKDCEYLVRKKLDSNTEFDKEIEERRKEEFAEEYSEINLKVYTFKQNFFRSIGKSSIGNSLEDYREQALAYLEGSFPFCFEIDLLNSEDLWMYNFWGIDIAFYAMCLGASEEQLGQLKDFLKNQKTIQFNNTGGIKYQSEPVKNNVSIDNIQGSALETYQADNLFDILVKINDKNIKRYIEHIMKNNGGLTYGNKIFDGVCVLQDEENNVFVEEGNHRVLTYKVLKAIKEYITGEKFNSININATLQRVSTKNIKDKKDSDTWEL